MKLLLSILFLACITVEAQPLPYQRVIYGHRVRQQTLTETPVTIFGSDLVGWYIADDIDESNQVANKSSGVGTTLTPGVEPTQGTLNGKKTLIFNGVDQYLVTSDFSFSQPATYIVLVKQLSWTASDIILNGATGARFLYQSAASPRLYASAGLTGPNTGTAAALNEWHAVFAYYSGTSTAIAVDGGANSVFSGGTSAAAGLAVGATPAPTPANFGHFEIAEILLLKRIWTDAEKTSVRTYWNTKYGLSL